MTGMEVGGRVKYRTPDIYLLKFLKKMEVPARVRSGTRDFYVVNCKKTIKFDQTY